MPPSLLSSRLLRSALAAEQLSGQDGLHHLFLFLLCVCGGGGGAAGAAEGCTDSLASDSSAEVRGEDA